MTRCAALAASALAVVLARDVSAAEKGEGARDEANAQTGPRIAARAGAGAPIGEAFAAGGALSDSIALVVPVGVELGLRISGHLYVGAIGEIGALVPRACSGVGARCTGTDTRIGGLVAYHFAPRGPRDPWLGVGASYERMETSRTSDGLSVGFVGTGHSLFDVHAGIDLALDRTLRIGPWLMGSVARFTAIEIDGVRVRDFDVGYHAWIVLGARGAWEP